MKQERPIHPARKFINSSQVDGKPSGFTESIHDVSEMFGSSAERLGDAFSRSMSTITDILAQVQREVPPSRSKSAGATSTRGFVPECSETHVYEPANWARCESSAPVGFVPECPETHSEVRERQLSADIQRSMGNFQAYGGCNAGPMKGLHRSQVSWEEGQREVTKSKSWEERQLELAKLRQQVHEQARPKTDNGRQAHVWSVINRTVELQQLAMAPEVREALQQRKVDLWKKNQDEMQRRRNQSGLTFQIKFGPQRGTRTYARRGERALDTIDL